MEETTGEAVFWDGGKESSSEGGGGKNQIHYSSLVLFLETVSLNRTICS